MRWLDVARLKTWYKVHKWISIFTGAILIMWLASGVLMVSQGLFPGLGLAPNPGPSAPTNYAEVRITPAEAIARVEQTTGTTLAVRSMWFGKIGTTPVYSVQADGRDNTLIDARNGEMVRVTPDLAERLAKERYQFLGDTLNTELITAHDLTYLRGPLPVYRVKMNDQKRTFVHVTVETGAVSAIDARGRLFNAVDAVHTFEFLKLLGGETDLLTGTLLWASIITSLAAVVVGYYLALPRRRELRRRSR